MSAAEHKYTMKQFSRTCTHCNYKVILLGDYGVGKTSIFRRIKSGKKLQRFDSRSTTGRSGVHQDTVDYCTKSFKMDNGKNVQVDFWDTGGAERYRGSLTQNYYKAATGIVLVYDATEPSSLTNLRTWIEDAVRYTNDVTFFLLGNKYDGKGPHQVDNELSDAFALHKNISLHFKISTQHSDDETFSDVLQRMAKEMYKKVELNFTATGNNGYCTTCSLGRDTVSLLPVVEAATESKSSCCSKS